MIKRLVLLLMVLVGLTITVFPILSTSAASGEQCSACLKSEEAVLSSNCPFTRVVRCWCETPPYWVCCLYQTCYPAYFGGPCTDCQYWKDCFVWYPCEGPYPTQVQK